MVSSQQWISSATAWSQLGAYHPFKGVMRFWGVLRLWCLKMKELKENFIWRTNKTKTTKKNLEKKKKKWNLPGKNPKDPETHDNGPFILEFLLVITLVESWGNRKVMTNIILLTMPHMQWGSSNLKTKGQSHVLAGVEAGPSQRKYKEDKKNKIKRWKKEKEETCKSTIERQKIRKSLKQSRQKEKEIKGGPDLKQDKEVYSTCWNLIRT